jgi:predicted transcriptional regulator
MRKKKGKSLAPPDLSAAWAAVMADSKTESFDAYRAAGWKTVQEIAEETGRHEVTIAGMMRSLSKQGKVEAKTIKAEVANRVRNCRIYRPKQQVKRNTGATHTTNH